MSCIRPKHCILYTVDPRYACSPPPPVTSHLPLPPEHTTTRADRHHVKEPLCGLRVHTHPFMRRTPTATSKIYQRARAASPPLTRRSPLLATPYIYIYNKYRQQRARAKTCARHAPAVCESCRQSSETAYILAETQRSHSFAAARAIVVPPSKPQSRPKKHSSFVFVDFSQALSSLCPSTSPSGHTAREAKEPRLRLAVQT